MKHGLLAIVLIAAIATGDARAKARPNILLIMSDNQSPSLLGAYGNQVIRTPNIDQLAAEGMLFERAYATSGVCSPARAVLFTGLIPSATGVHNGLPPQFPIEQYSAIAEYRNWPQTLADAGYKTALIGKYHLGTHAVPTLGFEHWVTFGGGHTVSFTDVEVFDNGERYNVADADGHLTDLWTRHAVNYIREHDADSGPFFLWLSYNGPYILPPTVNEQPVSRFAGSYADAPLPMPQHRVHPYLRKWEQDSEEQEDAALEGGTYPWAAIDALNNRQAMLNIAAETTHVDDGVGQVLQALDDAGVTADTLVIYLSDQGSSYGQLGLWGNSSWAVPPPAYNANMQVPLIFRHPGQIPAATTAESMINQYDVLPTVLDYVGLGHLELARSPGNSFLPMLRGETMEWEDVVFHEYMTTRVVQTRRWKYTKRFMDPPDELYDMAADPGETTNLVNHPDYAQVVVEMEARLVEFFALYADPEFDLWRGGTGKARLFYEDRRLNRFRQAFPEFREPFVEARPAFRD